MRFLFLFLTRDGVTSLRRYEALERVKQTDDPRVQMNALYWFVKCCLCAMKQAELCTSLFRCQIRCEFSVIKTRTTCTYDANESYKFQGTVIDLHDIHFCDNVVGICLALLISEVTAVHRREHKFYSQPFLCYDRDILA